MLCAERELETLDIALVYFDIGTQKETPVTQTFSAFELQAFFHEHCSRFLQWAQQEMAHRTEREQGEAFVNTLRRVGLDPFKAAANAVRSATARTPETA